MRNLSIAFAVIAAVSLLLITDLRVAIFVFLCVALTLLGKQSFSLKIIVDIYSYNNPYIDHFRESSNWTKDVMLHFSAVPLILEIFLLFCSMLKIIQNMPLYNFFTSINDICIQTCILNITVFTWTC